MDGASSHTACYVCYYYYYYFCKRKRGGRTMRRNSSVAVVVVGDDNITVARVLYCAMDPYYVCQEYDGIILWPPTRGWRSVSNLYDEKTHEIALLCHFTRLTLSISLRYCLQTIVPCFIIFFFFFYFYFFFLSFLTTTHHHLCNASIVLRPHH